MASNLPTPNFNYFKVDYSLHDVLDLFGTNLLFDFNCHAVGMVQSFNSENQTVTATINYTKTFLVPNPNQPETDPIPTYIQQPMNYPVLIDCPVVIMGGGPAYLTFPIAQGDECLVLFNDRDIDNWFATGQVAPPATGRLHSFSDGIVLVGLRSKARSIQSYDTNRALITNGNARVGINPNTNKCSIINNAATLNGALQTLINGILGMTSGGNPMVDVTGDIASAITQLGDLLE
jgi:hypothetical protein